MSRQLQHHPFSNVELGSEVEALASSIVEASSLVLLRLFIFILLLLFLTKISTCAHTHTHKKVSSKKYTTSLQEDDTVNTNIDAMMKDKKDDRNTDILSNPCRSY